MISATEDQLNLYLSLFRGRTDVYARRWEKEGKSGYSPAYDFDWNEFLAHKRRGGTMTTFEKKTAIPLTPDIIRKHLVGQHVVGVYPLLENNSSYFIAADFDGDRAFDEAKSLISVCQEIGLPAYLERSRSGNGAHVWLFFEEQYPAARSRVIMLECVRRALGLSAFDKEVSFDRLFPNQDAQSGKGFGNLIALPLQGISVERSNAIFIDPDNLVAFPDQWDFLAKVKRISPHDLDAAFAQLTDQSTNEVTTDSKNLVLILGSGIRLQNNLLDKATVNFIREELNFSNLDYWLKKRLGKSVYQTEKFFRLIEEVGEHILLPRGFLTKLTGHLRTRGIPFLIRDERTALPDATFTSTIELRPEQTDAVNLAMAVEQGVIVAPPGSGKTIMGLELIARRGQPALILTHRKQIMDQWVDRIQSFLGIAKAHIGRIDGVKKSVGDKVTVAMMQSLARREDLSDLRGKFGLVIVDECHHIPAKTFRKVISSIDAKYCYGLTATPERKHKDEKLIYLFIGDIVTELHEEHAKESAPSKYRPVEPTKNVIVRATQLAVPFSFTADNYQILARIVSFDQARNRLVLEDIKRSVAAGWKTLVLSERKEHLEVLSMYLKGSCEAILVTGDDSAVSRKSKFAQIASGHYQVILATGQLVGEGMDVPDIQAVVLAFPLAFEGKLAQYIGRIRGAQKTVCDYHDGRTPFLDRQFKKRKKFYEKSGFRITEES
ncbi:MAG: DEAD/DEAH box helicase family protein [Patescibacteria group bacterium]|jgi:superfamily II DNA or RNA helicase